MFSQVTTILTILLYHQVCPLLLRVFLSKDRHNLISEYKNGHTPPASSELQIYTWTDATLSELMDLVREVRENARQKGTLFSFCVVFPDPQSHGYRMRHLGVTCGGKRGPDDELTLKQSRFQIGDFIDLAVSQSGNIPPIVNEPPMIRHRGNRGRSHMQHRY